MKKKQKQVGTILEDLEKELNSHQPKWWERYVFWPTEKWYLDIRYFFKTRVPCYFQRARYGYSDEDIWSLDSYLCSVISGSVRKLRKNQISYPSEKGMTLKKWKNILKEIEIGFTQGDPAFSFEEGFGKVIGVGHLKKQKEAKKVFDKGSKLFIKYFFNLWD